MLLKEDEIKIYPNFLRKVDLSVLLECLFARKEIWETRKLRVPAYKNGEWYTLGASIYLDLEKESDWNDYCKKVDYFNGLLGQEFGWLYRDFLLPELTRLTGESWDFAGLHYPHLAFPGFHIFPPHRGMTQFFGQKHLDGQWQHLKKFPDFPDWELTEHLSGTLAIKMPPRGPHFLYGDELEKELTYDEGSLYIHTGQFIHAIAPLKHPTTYFDWRITLQFHGFKVNGVNYIYW